MNPLTSSDSLFQTVATHKIRPSIFETEVLSKTASHIIAMDRREEPYSKHDKNPTGCA